MDSLSRAAALLLRRPSFLALTALALAVAPARAEDPFPLLQPDQPEVGWTFDNGQEYAGAAGGLERDDTVLRGDHPTLKLTGDFSAGGTYVQGAIRLSPSEVPDIKDLSFWVQGLDSGTITIRLVDSADRCHQFRLKTEPTEDWQQVTFPLEEFFEKRGQPGAPAGISNYEAWGGGEDGAWSGPAKLFVIILGKRHDGDVRTIHISDVTITPRSTP